MDDHIDSHGKTNWRNPVTPGHFGGGLSGGVLVVVEEERSRYWCVDIRKTEAL